MSRPCPVRVAAPCCTLTVRSFQVRAAPGTCAWPPSLPSVPTSEMELAMAATTAPGPMMRRLYGAGSGVPALFAVQQDASGEGEQLALASARGLGSPRAGVLRTSFREETESDLFGEQAVLCG